MDKNLVNDEHFSDRFPEFSAILYIYQSVTISYLLSLQSTSSGLHVCQAVTCYRQIKQDTQYEQFSKVECVCESNLK